MPEPFSASDFAQPWLSQFRVADQVLAGELLDSMVLVSSDNFRNRLSDLIQECKSAIEGPVGLYVERELKLEDGYGRPEPLFSETHDRPRRSIGVGPPATSVTDSDVGSEGVAAQLISELCRLDDASFLNHPGPDDIRSRRVRALFLVTDFVGSGERACTYLDALWRSSSLRSWWSLKLVSLHVVAYSGTPIGLAAVRRHHSRPAIHIVRPCPTIDTEFDRQRSAEIVALCEKYDPHGVPSAHSIGFNGGGALLAYAHGLPDNAPLMLYKTNAARSWVPLFPSRVTRDGRQRFKDELTAEQISRRLKALNEYRLAVSPRLIEASSGGQRAVLVLAALRKGPRNEVTIASRTGLTIPEVRAILKEIKKATLVTEDLVVTEAGHRELKHYRGPRSRGAMAVQHNASPYYPKSLRPPRKKSS